MTKGLTIDEHIAQVDSLTDELEERNGVARWRPNRRRDNTMGGCYDCSMRYHFKGWVPQRENQVAMQEPGKRTFAKINNQGAFLWWYIDPFAYRVLSLETGEIL